MLKARSTEVEQRYATQYQNRQLRRLNFNPWQEEALIPLTGIRQKHWATTRTGDTASWKEPLHRKFFRVPRAWVSGLRKPIMYGIYPGPRPHWIAPRHWSNPVFKCFSQILPWLFRWRTAWLARLRCGKRSFSGRTMLEFRFLTENLNAKMQQEKHKSQPIIANDQWWGIPRF